MMILVCLSHVRLQHSGACTSRREEASSRIASSFSASKDFFFFLSFASKRARIILDTSSLLHRWPPRALNFFRLSSYFYIYFLVPLFAFPLACLLLLLFFEGPEIACLLVSRDLNSLFSEFIIVKEANGRGEHTAQEEKKPQNYTLASTMGSCCCISKYSRFFFSELFVVFSMSVSTDDRRRADCTYARCCSPTSRRWMKL